MYSELLETLEQDGFTIKIYAETEHMHPDECFDWEDDNHRTEVLKEMDSAGLIGWFSAKVTAEKAGVVLGKAYLGGCSYASLDQFLEDGYCTDMIDQAIDEAKKELPKLITKLVA